MVDNSSAVYVPVLKWRAGEKSALKSLPAAQQSKVLPLIELVVDEGDKPELLPNDIAKYWKGSAYLDVHLRPDGFAKTALQVIAANTKDVDIIPVARLNISQQIMIKGIKDVAIMCNNGVAIRIDMRSIRDFDIIKEELELLSDQLQIPQTKTDLIIDFGYIENVNDYNSGLKKLINQIDMSPWRRVVITAGSMPPTLTDFRPNEENIFPRLELNQWRVSAVLFKRNVIFGDYTTRYSDNFTRGGLGSISVRYTLENDFQIFRGTMYDKHYKFLAHALNIKTLYGDKYPASFSPGDQYIDEKAKLFEAFLETGQDPDDEDVKFEPGSKPTWVTASVSHHISVVLNQNL